MVVSKSTPRTVQATTTTAGTMAVVKLSNIDQILLRLYTRYLMFFPNMPGHEAALENLQRSLAETLDVFFPLAGRYHSLDNGALEIHCNNAGIHFIEASSDMSMAEAFGDFSRHSPEFGNLAPSMSMSDDITTIPLVIVQVTRFPCGGLSIVTGVHHNVADGAAAAAFVMAWSQKARNQGHQVSKPNFDRALMLARNPPSPNFPHVEFQKDLPNVPATFPSMRAELFTFTQASIKQLRDICHDDDSFTNFDLLAAHVWRSVTKARQLPEAATTSLGFSVEGRKQLHMDPFYFGNVIFYARAQASAHELVQGTLTEAVKAVRRAKQLVASSEYMKSAIDWIELQGSPVGIFPSFCDADYDFAVTSWTRFPLYQADFGSGPPSFVTIPVGAFTGLAIILPSGAGNEDLNILVGLYSEHMERLLSDPEFHLG